MLSLLKTACLRHPLAALSLGILTMLMLQAWVSPWAAYAVGAATKTHWQGAGLWHFRAMQSTVQVITWLIPAAFVGWLMGGFRRALGFQKAHSFVQYTLPVFMVILSLMLVQSLTFNASTFHLPAGMRALEASVHASEAQAELLLKPLLTSRSTSALAWNIFMFALLPAICEEAFFRGFLQRTFSRVMTIHAAVLLTGFIFSLIHFQFYGFFSRWFLGVIFGYMLAGSGSLFPSIIAHFLFNALQIVAIYVKPENFSSPATEAVIPFFYTIAAGMGLCAMFFVFLQQIPPQDSR